MTLEQFVLIAILIVILLAVAWHIHLGHQEVSGASKNVTIEMHTGDFWYCMMGKHLEDCNVTELDNNNFRMLSGFIELLAHGPIVRCD